MNKYDIFILVVELKSFSKAAEVLKTSVSAVSKAISKLEKELGIILIDRKYKKVSLTQTGQLFYEKCLQVSAQIKDLNNFAHFMHDTPQGKLKIVVPYSVLRVQIGSLLSQFNKQYPKVCVEVAIESLEKGDTLPNVNDRSYDIVVGSCLKYPGNIQKIRTHNFRYVLCASPKYLKKNGIPKKTTDLLQHSYIERKEITICNLDFFKHYFDSKEIIECQGGGAIIETLVLNHNGIGAFPTYHAKQMIKEGQMCQVLPTVNSPEVTHYIYYRKTKYIEKKVQVFLDFMKKNWSILS